MLFNLMNPWYGENTMEKVILIVALYILAIAILDFICVFGNLFGARKSYTLFIYQILPGLSLLLFVVFHWIIALPGIILFSKVALDSLKHDFKVIEQNESIGITGYNKWSVEKQRKKWELATEDYKQEYMRNSQNTPKVQLNLKLLFLLTFFAPITLIVLCSLFGLYYKFIL